MTTYGNTCGDEGWEDFTRKYSPDMIASYVDKGLRRMYTGTAPTLAQIYDVYGAGRYKGWMATMIQAIFSFAGLKESFPSGVMDTIAVTIKSEYPGMKATELMHFIYLFWLGTYDQFYGKPTAAVLMKMLRQYARNERDRLKGEYEAQQRKEDEEVERIRSNQALKSQSNPQLVAAMAAEALSDEARYKNGSWRYEPWGTAMARAFFVNKTLQAFPGDMTYEQRKEWAANNQESVRLNPNSNAG